MSLNQTYTGTMMTVTVQAPSGQTYCVRPVDIRDGMSNTILLGEKKSSQGWAVGGWAGSEFDVWTSPDCTAPDATSQMVYTGSFHSASQLRLLRLAGQKPVTSVNKRSGTPSSRATAKRSSAATRTERNSSFLSEACSGSPRTRSVTQHAGNTENRAGASGPGVGVGSAARSRGRRAGSCRVSGRISTWLTRKPATRELKLDPAPAVRGRDRFRRSW